MALTPEQLEKYGLSASDATASNHDKGIVQYGDNYYSINDFERQQSEGIDTDQGAVFSSALEADSGKDFTNFNTATDVEGALAALGGYEQSDEPVQYSPHLQAAHDRVNQWENDVWSGSMSDDIYGQSSHKRFDERTPAQQQAASITNGHFDDGDRQQKEAAQLFANNAVDKVKRDYADMLANSNQI